MGRQLSDVTLTDINKENVNLFSLAGANGLVLGFMHGTWCAYCLQQLRRNNQYADPLRERDVELVWVLKDTPSTIAAHLITVRPVPRYHVLPESEPSLIEQLQLTDDVSASPTLIYVDPTRTVRFVHAPNNPHAPHDMTALLHIIDEVAGSRGNG
jgi:peroxiredoxin